MLNFESSWMLGLIVIAFLATYIFIFYAVEPSGAASCLLDSYGCDGATTMWLGANFVANLVVVLLLNLMLTGRREPPLRSPRTSFCAVMLAATAYSIFSMIDNCPECKGDHSILEMALYLTTRDPFRGIAVIASATCLVGALIRIYSWAKSDLPQRPN